jgi:hypothetical protein
MMNLSLMLVILLGVMVFLFILWKRLKEDYTSTILFNTAFIILILTGIAGIISNFSYREYWFWFLLAGLVLGILLSVYKYKLNIYEIVESTFIGLMPILTLVYLTYAIILKSWQLLIVVALNITLVFLFIFLETHYKRFTWYKSGKVGVAGIMTLGLFFLVRGVIAMAFPYVLSFVGNYDAILSGSLALICFLMTYRLSKGEK